MQLYLILLHERDLPEMRDYSGSNGGICVDLSQKSDHASARGNTGSKPAIESTGHLADVS